MTATPTVYTRPTRYEVSALPEDHDFRCLLTVTVEYRGDDRWAVTLRSYRLCLGSDGKWDHERRVSERGDEWLATHRFDLETALRLAAEQVPLITVNGHTVADILARESEPTRAAIGEK